MVGGQEDERWHWAPGSLSLAPALPAHPQVTPNCQGRSINSTARDAAVRRGRATRAPGALPPASQHCLVSGGSPRVARVVDEGGPGGTVPRQLAPSPQGRVSVCPPGEHLRREGPPAHDMEDANAGHWQDPVMGTTAPQVWGLWEWAPWPPWHASAVALALCPAPEGCLSGDQQGHGRGCPPGSRPTLFPSPGPAPAPTGSLLSACPEVQERGSGGPGLRGEAALGWADPSSRGQDGAGLLGPPWAGAGEQKQGAGQPRGMARGLWVLALTFPGDAGSWAH